MDTALPGARPAKVLLWSMVSALLRGDKQGAAVFESDAIDPALAAVAAETLAEVIRIYVVDTKCGPRAMQDSIALLLATLAAETGPEPSVDDRVRHLGEPGWLAST